MNERKNGFTIRLKFKQIILPLILSSILLLLILQGLWLRKEYKDERENFNKQTHLLFRNIIFDMGDSLLLQTIKPINGDSGRQFFKRFADTSRFFSKTIDIKDHDTVSNVQVFVSSSNDADSIDRYLKPLISNIRVNRMSRRFKIRLTKDSLKTGDIEKKFKAALIMAHVDVVPFEVKSKEQSGMPPPRRVRFQEGIVYSPAGNYELNFSDLQFYILKKITPQILFSIFLTLLTITSFIILYRNILIQQRLMGLKNDFISNITHELKTPLTTVGVALEALKNFKGLENKALTEEYLEIAQKELGRLSILTDKILKTAIFEDKGITYTPQTIEFDKIIEEVIASMKVVIEKNNVQLSFEKQGIDFTIEGDEEHLISVIYNLLDNAIKYSPTNPVIELELISTERTIAFSVKDNGLGIPKEYHKKVFEKFFRVPTGNIHNIKGYGLGLSYVQSVVRSHSGKLEVISEPTLGSTFTLILNK